MIYLLNFLLVPIYYWIIRLLCKRQKQANKIFMITACIHATLFRALANPYNYVDTVWYVKGFEDMSEMNFLDLFSTSNIYLEWGLGYDVLCWVLGQFTSNYIYLYIVVSCLTIIPLFWFYGKSSDMVLITVLLFLAYPMMYLHEFGVIRQHLAITFSLIALYNIDKKIYSIFLVVLAFFIHTSAIVVFPYYVWRKFSFAKSSNIKVLFYVFGGVFVARMLFGQVLMSFSRYTDLLTSAEISNNIVPLLILGGFVLVGLLQHINKKLKEHQAELFNFCSYGLSVAIFSLGIPGMGRITLYFLYVIPAAMTFLSIFRTKFVLLNKLYILSLFVLTFILINLDLGNHAHFNYDYSFFWEHPTI